MATKRGDKVLPLIAVCAVRTCQNVINYWKGSKLTRAQGTVVHISLRDRALGKESEENLPSDE